MTTHLLRRPLAALPLLSAFALLGATACDVDVAPDDHGSGGATSDATTANGTSGNTGATTGGSTSATTSTGTGGSVGCDAPDVPDGEWGIPTSTFDLPPSAGGDLYYPDVQASFPNVDWSTLDRLYIPAGTYTLMKLGNLPLRSPEKPLVITNKGGQVKFETDYVYTIVLNGGANWVFTGKYDPISQTGDAAFPGHKGNQYATSRGHYGFELDGNFHPGSGPLLDINQRATDYEVSYVELLRSKFSGVQAKTHDDTTATMKNVKLHDLYIHDTESEGFYLGDTGASEKQHILENVEVYNNRVARTGTEAFQIANLGPGCNIHHNVFFGGAMDWLHPFQANYQNNNTQLSVRYGASEFHHNLVIGGSSTLMILMGQNVAADVSHYQAGDALDIHDNLFSTTKSMGLYVDPRNDLGTDYRFHDNLFRDAVFTYDYGYPGDTEPSFLVVHANQPSNAIEIHDNRYDSTQAFIDPIDALNGTTAAIDAAGNTNASLAFPAFAELGAMNGIDPRKLGRWFATFGPGPKNGQPLVYFPGDIVRTDDMHLYLCLQENDGEEPASHPASWQDLGLPEDDFRQGCDTDTSAIGLLQHK